MTDDSNSFPLHIEGLLCASLDDAERARLLAAVFRNKVVILRNQQLSLQEYANFVRKLGPTIPHVLQRFAVNGYPDVLRLSNLYSGGEPTGVHDGGCYWHTDLSYTHNPHVLTALYCVSSAPRGGATNFVDCAEGLLRLLSGTDNGDTPEFASGLDQAVVKHVFGNRAALRDPQARKQRLSNVEQACLDQNVFHPLICRHPVTDVAGLYACAGTSVEIRGCAVSDSVRVLDRVLGFLLTNGPRYRHVYQAGDVLLWDNLSTIHCGEYLEPTAEPDHARTLFRSNVVYSTASVRSQARYASTVNES